MHNTVLDLHSIIVSFVYKNSRLFYVNLIFTFSCHWFSMQGLQYVVILSLLKLVDWNVVEFAMSRNILLKIDKA